MAEDKEEKKPIIDKDLHVRDIHLVIAEFFDPTNHTVLTDGSKFQFRFRLVAALAIFALLRFTLFARIPKITEVLAAAFLGYVAVEMAVFLVNKFSNIVNEKSMPGVFLFIGVLLLITIATGLIL